jgi:ABC-type nitrate/sulfonate/bicarbonate transport system permease component
MRSTDHRHVALPWQSVVLLIAAITAWEVSADRTLVNTLFFPPPSAWLEAGTEMLRIGMLRGDLVATSARLGQGLLMGATTGYVFGLGLGASPKAYGILNPFIAFVHPLPKIALYPLLLILLGLGERPKVAVIAIAAFFPIFVTTVLGVRQIDPSYLDVARSHRASRSLTARRVIVPASIPAAIAGLRLSFNSSLTSSIALELVSAGDGLGARIWISWQNLRTDRLFVALTCIASLGFLSNLALQTLQRRLTPWQDVR